MVPTDRCAECKMKIAASHAHCWGDECYNRIMSHGGTPMELMPGGSVKMGSLASCGWWSWLWITQEMYYHFFFFLSSVIWVTSLRERCSVFTCSLLTLIGKAIKILVKLIRIICKNIKLTPHKWCSYPNINSDYTWLSAMDGYFFPFFLSAFFTYQIDSHEKLN